jgi:hypothetical protein
VPGADAEMKETTTTHYLSIDNIVEMNRSELSVDTDGHPPSEMRLLYPLASSAHVRSTGNNLSFSVDQLNIDMSNVPHNTTLNEIVSLKLKAVNESIHSGDFAFGSGELFESSPATLAGGNEAYKVVYSCYCSPDLSLMKFMDIWTVNNRIFYELEYHNFGSTYDADLPSAQKIIDSFEIPSRER